MSKPDLDQELQEWGRRRDAEVPPLQEERIRSIMEQLDKPLTTASEGPEPIVLMKRQLRRTRLALAAAVAIMIGLGALLLVDPSPVQPPEQAGADGAPAGLQPADLAELQLVANEAEQLFPEGIRWVSKINGEISMGIDNPRRLDAAAERLVVSYQVRRRDHGGQWEIVGRHDIITYADEPVRLEGDTPFAIWCHLVSDDRAALSLDLQFNVDGRALSITRDTLQTLGEAEVVHRVSVDGLRYEVVQAIYSI